MQHLSSITNAWHALDTGFVLPYLCSRDMLQLFDTALIGFLLEIDFKFTLNAFITVKHACLKIVI